jgi:hypothetical protein
MKATDRELVDALCEIESGLSDDEIDFVEYTSSAVIDVHRELTAAEIRRGVGILRRLRRKVPKGLQRG